MVGLVSVPLVFPAYPLTVATLVLIFALFAMSLDILWGYTGLFSLGHAVFLGVGGYTAGLLVVRYGQDNFWLTLAAGTLVATAVGAVIGPLALRLAGAYFLLLTLAVGQLFVALATRWSFMSTQPGVEGLYGIHLPSLGLPFASTVADTSQYYWLVLALVLASYWLMRRVTESPAGLAIQGIAQNETRMQALGFNTWAHKYLAFVIASAFAGVAGVLLAFHQGFMVPADFGIETTTLAVLMVLIGGAGTLTGPILGAVLILLLEVVVSAIIPERWPLVLGAGYIVAVALARNGLIRRLDPLTSRLWRRGEDGAGIVGSAT
jgi:branched-chain amino acid transport system permease protein